MMRSITVDVRRLLRCSSVRCVALVPVIVPRMMPSPLELPVGVLTGHHASLCLILCLRMRYKFTERNVNDVSYGTDNTLD